MNKCETCGAVIPPDRKYCEECLMERFSNTEKNLHLGGRFYEEEIEEDNG